METQRDVVIPEAWLPFYEATGVPAAVREGDRIWLTGHTGDAADGTFAPDAEGQLRQTFANLGQTLAAAGASWADVVQLTSHHVGIREQGDLPVIVAAEFMSRPFPAWTAVGVTGLYEAEALVEITCVAVVDPLRT